MDTLNVCWTTGVLIITTVALFLYRHFTKLRRCGIPGPTPWPFFGNSLQQQKLGTEVSEQMWLKKYGKVYGRYQGFIQNVVVTDPEVLKSILIKDFTNFTDRANSGNVPSLIQNGLFFMRERIWKRTRNILTPTFSAAKIKHMISTINKNADVLTSVLLKHIDETVIVKDFFSHFTIDTLASTAFSIDIGSQINPDNPYIKNMTSVFNSSKRGALAMVLTALIPGIGPLLFKLGISFWSIESADFFEQMGKTLITERKTSKTKHADFLEMMLNAEFDGAKREHGVTLETASSEDHKQHIEHLTDEEMNGQIFGFFLGGMETTAALLMYSAYALALHPDIDEKLVEEIQEHVGLEDPTYETVNKLKYMDQFINEVLRVYPPVTKLNRKTKEDIQLGEMTIPKGSIVVIPVWMIHHSEENFPNPETFDPDRFSSENKGIKFLSFGAGPRNCIGMRLALVESKIALVYLLRKLRFVKSEKTQIPLELQHFEMLRPTLPIQLLLQAR